MTLQAAIDRHLPRLRAEAEGRMRTIVRVERVATTADPLTGRDIEAPEVVIEALPCRIKRATAQAAAEATAAGVQQVGRQLHCPWDTVGLREGLRAVVTHSDQPSLLRRTYRLTGWGDGDQMTAQRWEVEEWTASKNSSG